VSENSHRGREERKEKREIYLNVLLGNLGRGPLILLYDTSLHYKQISEQKNRIQDQVFMRLMNRNSQKCKVGHVS